MRRALHHARGFTLLEVMIASVIGVIVLGIGLVAGMQMQRRAIFEEQTMLAQVTGRAVKELLAADVSRTGLGMGNTPIRYSETDLRSAIQVWNALDMRTEVPGFFAADPTFQFPTGRYSGMRSDVLQLHWGDSRNMTPMVPCNLGTGPVRNGNSFCMRGLPPAHLQPPSGQSVPALVVNPLWDVACHIQVDTVETPPGPNVGKIGATVAPNSGPATKEACSDSTDKKWEETGWFIMQPQGAAYRVNWVNNIPTLEYLAPGAPNWVVVSRDVERMTIRQGVMNMKDTLQDLRWYPNTTPARPDLSNCTTNNTECNLDDGTVSPSPNTHEGLRRMLQQRVRALEVTLVVRTRRLDQTLVQPITDEEGFPLDGFKRRTYSFRVAPRNYGSVGIQPEEAE
ncbi:PilW family protein [Myxococcus landrumensis]|uniref:Prepilin-type N-terminal cleavage/methylation domain-containing protein n=1 Tax=Myxococcus landrumensis TaxID=2813577 RepID=A0ABX7MZ23_9BACT|nr:prepilin-type N-terminal cleavage/methylation domain-containing protein [Myxococcus landrumus]QSQ11598.1 prepilin-type N-terminal cleavage/methylation domain-containing protein [Myxococcus landrumus]